MSIYSHVYQNLLMPLHGIVRNRHYVRHRALLERTQWWSRDQLLEFQWQELLRLLEHTFRSVPYYQEKYRKAGIVLSDIRTREDFARLPILTRAEVNENRARLCSTEFRGKLLPHATGGSSGTPTRFFRTIESYDWRTAAKDRVYSWSGWRPGEKAAYLWGAPVGKVPRFQAAKTRAYDSFHRQLVINTFSQNDELWEEVRHRIMRFRPRIVVGYVSSLAEFSAFLLRRGLHIPPIEAVIAAAEPLYAGTRQQIGEAPGAPAGRMPPPFGPAVPSPPRPATRSPRRPSRCTLGPGNKSVKPWAPPCLTPMAVANSCLWPESARTTTACTSTPKTCSWKPRCRPPPALRKCWSPTCITTGCPSSAMPSETSPFWTTRRAVAGAACPGFNGSRAGSSTPSAQPMAGPFRASSSRTF